MSKFYPLFIAIFLWFVTFGPSKTRASQIGIEWKQCTNPELDKARCGSYEVFENTVDQGGKKISLNIVILQALDKKENVPPVLFLAGGPGQGAASSAGNFNQSWARQHQDLILIDQRGTGASNPLDCKLSGTDENLQSYLGPIFPVKAFAECKQELLKKADLKWYSTPVAMADINEVREALGHQKISLWGISGGTRSAMVFLQKYSQHVHSVILNGVVPFEFRNPLYHAEGAQLAIDRLFAECRQSEACRSGYPNLEEEFNTLLVRLDESPVTVEIRNPYSESSSMESVELSRNNVAETIRVFMYSSGRIARLPKLIHEAYQEDYQTFAEVAVRRNRALRTSIQLGTLLTIICTEDISRIREEEIPDLTEDTFLGDERVLTQAEVCKSWPEAYLPEDYELELQTDVPALLLTGTMDPVTPPKWGDQAKNYFSNVRHLVVPGGHGVGDPCLESIMSDFVVSGKLSTLNYSCLEEQSLPAFE